MKAMILAAGLGTRLKPFTDFHPKALAIVNGKSLLQRNVEYLLSHGFDEIIVNVHHFASQIIEAIEHNKGWGAQITISDESDLVLETGGGLKKAAWFFNTNEPFAVMNADILTDLNLSEMLKFHFDNNALATLAVSERSTSRYFLFNTQNQLCGWENIKTGEQKITRNELPLTRKAFSGIHIISPQLPKLILQEGKFSMVDVYLSLSEKHVILGYNQGTCKFLDVGKPESIAEAELLFN